MSVPTTSGVSVQHKVAALITAALAVFQIVWSIPQLDGGSAKADQVPWVVIVLGFAMSIVALVAAYGVWRGQRWGVVLTIVLTALSFIIGAPGILFGPTAFLVISSIVNCALDVAVVVLLLRRPRVSAAGAGRAGTSTEVSA